MVAACQWIMVIAPKQTAHNIAQCMWCPKTFFPTTVFIFFFNDRDSKKKERNSQQINVRRANVTPSYCFSSPLVFPLHVLGIISGLLPLSQFPVFKTLRAQHKALLNQNSIWGPLNCSSEHHSVCNERPQIKRLISFWLSTYPKKIFHGSMLKMKLCVWLSLLFLT